MKKEAKKTNKFTLKMQKKLVVLYIFVLLAFGGLSVRLFVINKENGEAYKKQVLSQQKYSSVTIPFKRGDILDTKGSRLATSEKVYNLIVDSKILLEKEDYLEPTLKALDECFEVDINEIRNYVSTHPTSAYYVVLKKLTYEEISSFIKLQNDKKANPNIKGVWFEEEYRRVYPNNSLACDVIGFTGTDNTGSNGLEKYYNDILNGTNGREYGYLNDDATLERTTKAAVNGNSIVTTIDANIQSIVEKYVLQFNEEHRDEAREGLGSTNTGVIVMNPNNGEILAMASYPTFDLNNPKDLSAYYSQEDLDAMDDETREMKWNELWRNFCIFNTYEPGSTAKAFTIATALEYGKITGNETYQCNGSLQIKGVAKPIRCNAVHGLVDVSGALEQSCNVAMMEMGMQSIGKDIFMKGLENFNFGLKTNIDLTGEARTASLLFDVNKMVPTDLAIGSFGQGYNVTMIQLAAAFSSVINGGYYYEPHMVSKIVSSEGATVENVEPRILKQTISQATSEKLVSYLDAVVTEGTGKSARPAGYTMGGKTGTAEKYPRGTGNYVVSFIGYVPAQNPEVVIYVVIDEPNVADQPHSSFAKDIVRDIMTEVLPYMGIYQTEELSEAEQKELEEKKLLSVSHNQVDQETQDNADEAEDKKDNEGISENETPQVDVDNLPETSGESLPSGSNESSLGVTLSE